MSTYSTGVPISTGLPTTPTLRILSRTPETVEDLWAPYSQAGLHVRAGRDMHCGIDRDTTDDRNLR